MKKYYGSIYKGILIDVGTDDIRVLCPDIDTYIPLKDKKSIDIDRIKQHADSYLKPMWCVPNSQAQRHESEHPCWIAFENGDVNKPILMGWLGRGIMYSASSSGSGGDSSWIASAEISDWLAKARVHKGPLYSANPECPFILKPYLKDVFGIDTNLFGDGKDCANNLIANHGSYFKDVDYTGYTCLKPGDVLSIDGPSSAHGHVMIIDYVKDGIVYTIEQWNGQTDVCGQAHDQPNESSSTFTYGSGNANYNVTGLARPIINTKTDTNDFDFDDKLWENLGSDFQITHYCCEKYPHICNAGPPYKTASGTTPHVGGCAVDPSIIPLGSYIKIDGTILHAEDTGGAIKGHRVDIVVETHNEAMQLGRLFNKTVYIYKGFVGSNSK